MIIAKDEFKQLKKGGTLRCIIIVDSNVGSGNLCANDDGIFFERTFKDKYYFSFERITEFEVSGLNVRISENNGDKIRFTCKKQKHVIALYNEYAKYNNLDIITADDIKNEKKEQKEAEKQRKKELFEKIMASDPEVSAIPKNTTRYTPPQEKQVCCPKCGSTQLSANKKGVGLGKAAVGAIAVGPLGLVAGGIGKNKVLITCLNCGKQFKPGK